MDDQDFLEQLKQEFYFEAAETLNECQDLLKAAQETTDEDEHNRMIQEYKTSLHTLKGSSHAVEYDDVARFIHFMEDTIKELRGPKRIEVNQRMISILFKFIELAKSGNVTEANIVLNKVMHARIKPAA